MYARNTHQQQPTHLILDHRSPEQDPRLHTSVNYQIQAPEPFNNDVHEDLHADLARISSQDHHPSEFDLHLDLFRTFKRVNDGTAPC